jgi:hypothetical protein
MAIFINKLNLYEGSIIKEDVLHPHLIYKKDEKLYDQNILIVIRQKPSIVLKH